MEIELIKKKQEGKKVKFEDLNFGTVIKVEDRIGIVIDAYSIVESKYQKNNRALLLVDNLTNILLSCDWIENAIEGNFQVIGKAKKLIVEAT